MKSLMQFNLRPQQTDASCWWIKDIDKKQARELRVADKVLEVLDLLNKIDNLTIDIKITIKNNHI